MVREPGFSAVGRSQARWVLAVVVIGAIFLSIGVTLVVAAETGKAVFHRGNREEPDSLDPHVSLSVFDANITLDLFVGLTTLDAGGRTVAGAATDWTVSPDGRVYTFNLRPGMVWSDGTPLTAEDFVYSLRRALAPETASMSAYLLYPIENAVEVNTGRSSGESLGVRAVNPDTVEIRLRHPAPYMPGVLTQPVGVPVPRHVVEEHGRTWSRPGHMVSNGAFVLAEWVPNHHVRLVKNELFYDAAGVALEEVFYYPLGNVSAALNRFRAGALDSNPGFPDHKLEWLRENLPDSVRLGPTLTTVYLALNVEKPPLDDPRVRRALALAIDREKIVTRLRKREEPPAYSLVPPGIEGYGSPSRASFKSMPMEQRLVEAARLLKAAGYGPEHPLEIDILYIAAGGWKKTGIVVASMWRAVGVRARLMSCDGKVHTSSLQIGDFEVGLTSWSADFADASNFLEIQKSSSAANFPRWSNEIYDRLLDEADLEPDPVVRADLLHRAEAVLMEDLPIIPLYHPGSASLVAPYVEGWVDNPLDVHPSRWLSLER